MNTRLSLLASLLVITALTACSSAPPPPDNAVVDDGGAPLAVRAVKIGSEGANIAACPSISKVKATGTSVYWAPGETRAVKAQLAGGERVALCEAADNDAWFGVVFAAPGTDMDNCKVGRSTPKPKEYQGPCRWGWIKGGTVELGG